MLNNQKINFVFFYIKKNEKGTTSENILHIQSEEDVSYFISSIKKNHPEANIVQCTDLKTPKINGTNMVLRENIDQTKIMEARIFLYSKLNFNTLSVFLDTDMLLLRKIPFELLIEKANVFLLKRSFNLDAEPPQKFRGQNYDEHENGTLGKLYPYIGCFVIVNKKNFWKDCYYIYKKYSNNYKFWFGDQKALSEIVSNKSYKFAFLNESDFACPPVYTIEKKPPYIIHFKGKNYKSLIKKYYHHIYGNK